MRFLKIYHSLIVLILLFSCKKERGFEFIDLEYKSFGFESFDFTDLNYDVSRIQFNKKEDEFLFFDEKNQKLLFFDRGENLLKYVLEFSDEGANAVEEISAIHYHNSDSIFLARLGYFSIYLINREGKKVNQWDVDYEMDLGDYDFYTGMFGIGGFDKYNVHINYDVNEEKLFADFNPVVFEDENSFPFTYQLPITSSLNLNDGKIEVFGSIPESYRGKTIPHDLFFPFAITNEYLVITFPSSHEIFRISRNNNEFEFKYLPSKYINESDFKKYSNKDGGEVFDFWTDWNNKALYAGIVTEKESKNNYRIVKHPHKNAPENKDFLECDWSLIKLDSAFSYIGEVKFPANIYDFNKILLIKDTIYISRMNPFSKSLDENNYIFEKILVKDE